MKRLRSAYWAILSRFMRLFFRHLYTTLAWSYDLVSAVTSVGQWATWQRTVLDLLPQGPLLELGHGTGRLLSDLRLKGASVVGVDPSRQMTRIAADRLRSANQAVCSVRARAQALPMPPDSFQAVFATFPSAYILDDKTLHEVHRVLVQEGTFLIVGLAHIHGTGLLDRLASVLYRITGQSREPSKDWDAPLIRLGFQAELVHVRLPRATVLHVRAVKT